LFSKAKILIITEEVEEAKQEPVLEKVKKAEPKIEQVKIEQVKIEQVKIEQKQKTEQKQEEKAVVKKDQKQQSINEKPSITFIKTLAEKLGAKVEAEVKQEDENLVVCMKGENAGVLIGYRGEGLSGIQYLANVIEQQNEEKENRVRIFLNVENYKEKREESLKRLADRMANKAIKTGRSQRLEPMNAYERRIIHAALTDSNVTTYSKGEEPRRYLVIEPKR
jgi:spoIIIJ-associated protein